MKKGVKMKIVELLNIGQNKLRENSIDIKEARLILAFVLNVNIEKLILISKDDELDEDIVGNYLSLLDKRIRGIPYAYLINNREFMGLDFYVDENVLIPRPDTEILVQCVIDLKKKNILDLCTGSGCIAISIAKNIKDANVYASDISEKAIEIAKQNAKNNFVDVRFFISNLFENIDEKFDVIVSNPPYIKTNVIKELEKEVKSEPNIALDGGVDGLDFYRKIITDAKKYLNNNGYLALEIGYDQKDEVYNLLTKNNYKNIKVIKDLGGNFRVLLATT
jgi:release factor glutamine methyltransferase